MFKKISNNFLNLDFDWTTFKSETVRSSHYSKQRQGGAYFYDLKNSDLFHSLHKKNIFGIKPQRIFFCEFTGGGLVTPHRDKGNSVSLNFYIDVEKDYTVFYEDDSAPTNISFYSVDNTSNLIESGRFMAEKFDIYLLDVRKLHGIEKTNNNTRRMITYRWSHYTFDEIYESLDSSIYLDK